MAQNTGSRRGEEDDFDNAVRGALTADTAEDEDQPGAEQNTEQRASVAIAGQENVNENDETEVAAAQNANPESATKKRKRQRLQKGEALEYDEDDNVRYVLDEQGNRIPMKDKNGRNHVDEDGKVVYRSFRGKGDYEFWKMRRYELLLWTLGWFGEHNLQVNKNDLARETILFTNREFQAEMWDVNNNYHVTKVMNVMNKAESAAVKTYMTRRNAESSDLGRRAIPVPRLRSVQYPGLEAVGGPPNPLVERARVNPRHYIVTGQLLPWCENTPHPTGWDPSQELETKLDKWSIKPWELELHQLGLLSRPAHWPNPGDAEANPPPPRRRGNRNTTRNARRNAAHRAQALQQGQNDAAAASALTQNIGNQPFQNQPFQAQPHQAQPFENLPEAQPYYGHSGSFQAARNPNTNMNMPSNSGAPYYGPSQHRPQTPGMPRTVEDSLSPVDHLLDSERPASFLAWLGNMREIDVATRIQPHINRSRLDALYEEVWHLRQEVRRFRSTQQQTRSVQQQEQVPVLPIEFTHEQQHEDQDQPPAQFDNQENQPPAQLDIQQNQPTAQLDNQEQMGQAHFNDEGFGNAEGFGNDEGFGGGGGFGNDDGFGENSSGFNWDFPANAIDPNNIDPNNIDPNMEMTGNQGPAGMMLSPPPQRSRGSSRHSRHGT